MNNSAKEIGQKLKKARLAKKLSQSDVAEASDINTNYYARIERGEVNASLDIFKAILKALGLKSEDVLPF